jgi:hypothetical protein
MIWGSGWKSLRTTALDAFKTFVLPSSNWLQMQCLPARLVLLTPYRRADAAGSSPKLSELADPEGTTRGHKAQLAEVKMFTNTRRKTLKKKV